MVKIASVFSLAALLFAAPALAAPTVVAHSTVKVFNAARMTVTRRQSGHCWTSSIASQRSDAYRCMIGNEIEDPCFKLSAKEVACPTDVASNRGIVIALTRPLPPAEQTGNAWQMELMGGVHCNIGTGTLVAGYPFYCTGGLVCSSPPPGAQRGAVFVHCGTPVDGKVSTSGSYLVRILYE